MLAVNESNFAIVALDFLVDMFNDDIQEVRLKAIDSLCKMSDHIEFREDQLEIILGLLEVSFCKIWLLFGFTSINFIFFGRIHLWMYVRDCNEF